MERGKTRLESKFHFHLLIVSLISHENVIDGNVNQLDKETNESHDEKSSGSCLGDRGKLFPVGLSALLDQMHRVLGKLPEGLNEHLVESFLFCHFSKYCNTNKGARESRNNKMCECWRWYFASKKVAAMIQVPPTTRVNSVALFPSDRAFELETVPPFHNVLSINS